MARKLYRREVLEGTYQKIDTSTIIHMTAAEIAAASDKMIACGGWNLDDIRRKAGDAPLNTEWSKKHFITRNYSEMDSADAQNSSVETHKGDGAERTEKGGEHGDSET